MDSVVVNRAALADLPALANLFDGYRRFYNQSSDLEGAQRFLRARMTNNDSVIFVAAVAQELVGFTQLYPTFSSVSMQRDLILNDLFVSKSARRTGAGMALMNAAADYGRSIGAKSLRLETDEDNSQAQALYERLDYQRDSTRHYVLSLI